jgi:glycosyltransferase involved in cell wall biosynthesis
LTQNENYYNQNSQSDSKNNYNKSQDINVVRTRKFDVLNVIYNFRNSLYNRGNEKVEANGTNSSPKSNSENITSKSIWQKMKDFLTWLPSIPDREIGWLPFAVFRGYLMIKKHKIDMIFSSCPPHSVHLISLLLKLLTGKRLVLDFRDPWSRSQWEPLNASKLERIEKNINIVLERWAIKKADKIICNTAELRDDFIKFYKDLPQDKFQVFYNGYDPDNIPNIMNGKSDCSLKVKFTHTGTLYKRRDPSPLFHAIKQLIEEKQIDRDKISIQFIGAISEELWMINRLVKELKLEDIIKFIKPVNYRESLDYMLQSDVLILLQPGTLLQIPAKVFDYMCAEKPILAIGEKCSATERIIQEQFGIFVDYNNIKEIMQGFIVLYKNNNFDLNKLRLARNRFNIAQSIQSFHEILSFS